MLLFIYLSTPNAAILLMATSYQQVCYVLTSNGHDIYADMNLLSVWSLRETNQNIRILLLCDTATSKNLNQSKHKIVDNIDELISIKVSNGPPEFRSRYLKTSMRMYIDGSFLFLDVDTFIRGDLNPIYKLNRDFAAVPNNNGTGKQNEMIARELKVFSAMGWSRPRHCLNSGVLYFSSSNLTHTLAENWHRKWLDCSSKTGQYFDQPSLNSALSECDLDFSWMDHRYNAQVHARPETARDAVIWHIFSSGQNRYPQTLFDLGRDYLSRDDAKSLFIAKLRQCEHPWLDFKEMQKWRHRISAEYFPATVYHMLAAGHRTAVLRLISRNLALLMHVQPPKMILGILYRALITGKPPRWFKPAGGYEQYAYLFRMQ